eukprot:CAMPEP_0175703838 /NCGR_PEP_ID=MMETSP0097-20121207/36720_1 /TAXON_ID=311494 /ORGANISM="Alexandrium monilatum, Strain CCMP3105" /LENGTH=308 /DNA_ID=CAMNT_0017011133 /DNA_START=98 /DNA_END=1021 /DNA_ORIENTATION=+
MRPSLVGLVPLQTDTGHLPVGLENLFQCLLVDVARQVREDVHAAGHPISCLRHSLGGSAGPSSAVSPDALATALRLPTGLLGRRSTLQQLPVALRPMDPLVQAEVAAVRGMPHELAARGGAWPLRLRHAPLARAFPPAALAAGAAPAALARTRRRPSPTGRGLCPANTLPAFLWPSLLAARRARGPAAARPAARPAVGPPTRPRPTLRPGGPTPAVALPASGFPGSSCIPSSILPGRAAPCASRFGPSHHQRGGGILSDLVDLIEHLNRVLGGILRAVEHEGCTPLHRVRGAVEDHLQDRPVGPEDLL